MTDYESVGRGFESLLAYHRMQRPEANRFPVSFYLITASWQRRQKFIALGLNFWEGTDSVEHATGMFFVNPLLAYQRGNKISPMDWINAVERMVLQRFLLSKCQSFPIIIHLIP